MPYPPCSRSLHGKEEKARPYAVHFTAVRPPHLSRRAPTRRGCRESHQRLTDEEPAMNRGQRSSLLLAAAALVGFATSAAAVDIDLRTNTGFVVWGAVSQDNTGRAVAFGDLDGDGFRDIIIGSIGVDGSGATIPNSGAVDIVWGDTRVNLGASKDLLTDSDVRIEGADTGDQVGVFVVSGDFDGDGLADLAMAASLGDGPGNIRPDAGDVYIYYGRARGAWAGINNVSQRDVIIYGADACDNSGISLAVGDIDADGIG